MAPYIFRQHGKFWLLLGGYVYVDGAMEGEAVADLAGPDCYAEIPSYPLIVGFLDSSIRVYGYLFSDLRYVSRKEAFMVK